MGKVRPQIFLSILVLGILAYFGTINDIPEIATATIGGIIALGMKVLEAEQWVTMTGLLSYASAKWIQTLYVIQKILRDMSVNVHVFAMNVVCFQTKEVRLMTITECGCGGNCACGTKK